MPTQNTPSPATVAVFITRLLQLHREGKERKANLAVQTEQERKAA